MNIEKVIVGIDFSRPGTEAAQWVVQQFAPDAEIILAHVIDLPRTPTFLQGVVSSDAELEASARTAAEPQLRELASFLTPARARTVIRTGRAHEELAKVLLVVGDEDADGAGHGPASGAGAGPTGRITRKVAPAPGRELSSKRPP